MPGLTIPVGVIATGVVTFARRSPRDHDHAVTGPDAVDRGPGVDRDGAAGTTGTAAAGAFSLAATTRRSRGPATAAAAADVATATAATTGDGCATAPLPVAATAAKHLWPAFRRCGAGLGAGRRRGVGLDLVRRRSHRRAGGQRRRRFAGPHRAMSHEATRRAEVRAGTSSLETRRASAVRYSMSPTASRSIIRAVGLPSSS